MTLRDVLLRLRALAARRRVESELHEELAFHIERETQKYLAAGLSPADARARAVARFGSVPRVADECRDARGTGLVETTASDVSYAFRTFRRAPLPALTIVATVALGLGLVTVVFTIYNVFFLRTDDVRNPSELFGVERVISGDTTLAFTTSEYDALRRETSVFVDVSALVRPVRARVDGRRVTAALVTGNFFDMLGVPPAAGRALRPDDDGASSPRLVIVLSDRGRQKLFAGDPSVIGRRVRINGVLHEVVGVMPESFRGIGITSPDYWAPLGLIGGFREPEGAAEEKVDIVGRLKPGVSPQAAAAELSVWAARSGTRAGSRTLPIRLSPRQGTLDVEAAQALLVFSPVFFAFGLILMLGCANVANLQLARGVSRQRELAIRLSVGGSRRRIVRQLLTENLVLALAAAACGLGISRLLLGGALYAALTTMPPEFSELVNVEVPTPDCRVVVFLIAGAVVSTVLFGLVPALQATRLELVRTMRGEVTREARPGRARHVLIALQVGSSALLLICAGIFLRSAIAMALVDPGVRTSDTIRLAVMNESRRAAVFQTLSAHPLVAGIAGSSRPARAIATTSGAANGPSGNAAGATRQMPVDRVAASPEYFRLLDIEVVQGRGFTPAERSEDAAVAVVSETAARNLWPAAAAVGQVIQLRPSESGSLNVPEKPSRAFTVIGVLRDVNGPLAPDLFPSFAVYVPGAPESPGTGLTLRVHGDPEQARQALIEPLLTVDPGLGEFATMRTIAGMQTYFMRVAFGVAVALGGLALLLTLSGLFSVLSYIVEQRSKEIGVRMALGATARNVVALMLVQSLRPVGIGLGAGGGLAVALATLLLGTPSAGEITGIVRLLDPVPYTTGVIVVITACLFAALVPTWRAVRIDPIATLRNE